MLTIGRRTVKRNDVWVWGLDGTFGKAEGRTADPSAALLRSSGRDDRTGQCLATG